MSKMKLLLGISLRDSRLRIFIMAVWGEIVAVDDSTMNVLFVIEKDGDELLLPAHEEFIIDLDRENRVLKVDIPDGLLE